MTEEIRSKIIKIYLKNVHGKIPDTTSSNQGHDGKVGHWLETQMGIKHNASNSPDLFGYEMKNHTKGALTLGSWDPNYWIFTDKKYKITRDTFMDIFGHANPKKHNRMSWSGIPIPKIDKINTFGMKIVINKDNNIYFVYSYSKDSRTNKHSLVPKKLQTNNLVIAKWNAIGKKSLSEKVENKFNQNGWFECVKNKDDVYDSIVFGLPFTFETFITYFKAGKIYFDSGMHKGNDRNYCQWRTHNSFWNSLIVERHP